MGRVDLMRSYPKLNRDIKKRKKTKTTEMISLASKWGWEAFDVKGICYNGYVYDGRWIPVAKDIIKHYNLKVGSKILDIGSAKGYFVYDLVQLGMDAYGIDISEYARDCAPPSIKKRLKISDIKDSNWASHIDDNEYDLVTSFITLPNLNKVECINALREIERIGKNSFITVDTWETEEQRKRMLDWTVTAVYVPNTKEWLDVFKQTNYTGDYDWFWP